MSNSFHTNYCQNLASTAQLHHFIRYYCYYFLTIMHYHIIAPITTFHYLKSLICNRMKSKLHTASLRIKKKKKSPYRKTVYYTSPRKRRGKESLSPPPSLRDEKGRYTTNRDVPLMHDYDNASRGLSPCPRDIRTADRSGGASARKDIALHSRERVDDLDRDCARPAFARRKQWVSIHGGESPTARSSWG